MNILLLTSLTFIIIHLHCFRCFDILHIPKPSNKFFLPWGFVFLACCQVSEQSEEKLPAETRQQPNDGTAADASKVAPCGGMWVQLGREMQTFWFFRGDRSGRSSDVSCPLILQWTLDNYGTILIHELVCYVLRIFLICLEMFWAYMNILLLPSFTFIIIHLHCFTMFYILSYFADSKTIKQGLSAMGICVSGLLSGFRAVGGETSCRDPPASQRSCWCKQGSSLWWDVGRQMQTFWFFRGDRSGRSSDVSCPLILQWTLDNYGTILIHEFFWILLICFENFWDVLSFEMFWAYMNILLLTSFTFLYILLIIVNIFFLLFI